MGATKADLFDEDSDQEDRDADPSHLRVNEEYAKRFEVSCPFPPRVQDL